MISSNLEYNIIARPWSLIKKFSSPRDKKGLLNSLFIPYDYTTSQKPFLVHTFPFLLLFFYQIFSKLNVFNQQKY